MICKDDNSLLYHGPQKAGVYLRIQVQSTVLQSPSGVLYPVLWSLVLNVEAATSNSSFLLAVCPVHWPASTSLTGLFCLTGVTDSSYLIANFIQCCLKTTSSLTGHSGLCLSKKEHIVNQWNENNVKRAFISPQETLFLLLGMCTVYTLNFHKRHDQRSKKQQPP